jgi:hypothetical protein
MSHFSQFLQILANRIEVDLKFVVPALKLLLLVLLTDKHAVSEGVVTTAYDTDEEDEPVLRRLDLLGARLRQLAVQALDLGLHDRRVVDRRRNQWSRRISHWLATLLVVLIAFELRLKQQFKGKPMNTSIRHPLDASLLHSKYTFTATLVPN